MAKTKPFVFYTDTIQFKSEETEEGTNYFIEGYISTKDIDLVNDIVTENALNSMLEQLKNRNIKIDFEHEAFRGEDDFEQELNKTRIPLGRIISQTKDEKGIKIVAQLNPSWKKFDKNNNVVMDFKDIWKSIKNKFLDAFSIAYIPIKTAVKKIGETSVRLLDDINLLNVALTGNPVNPNATLTSVMAKSLEYMKEIEQKPFGPYSDFDDCVRDQMKKGHSEDSAKKICATIHKKITGKWPSEKKGDIMVEEEDKPKDVEETKEPEQKAEEPVKEEVKSEETNEPKEEPKEEPKPEQKSIDELQKELLEVKSLVDKLKKENEELKSIVEKAQHKAIGYEDKSKIKELKADEGLKNPLDVIV